MKYLKYFESGSDDVEINSIRKFCNDYLAELIDGGFNVNVYYFTPVSGKSQFEIILTKYKKVKHIMSVNGHILNKYAQFTWDIVKDDFIPFFAILDQEYDIQEIEEVPYTRGEVGIIRKKPNIGDVVEFHTLNADYYYYPKEEVLKGECGRKRNLNYIKIYIKEKAK